LSEKALLEKSPDWMAGESGSFMTWFSAASSTRYQSSAAAGRVAAL